MNVMPVDKISGDIVKVVKTDPRHMDLAGNMGPDKASGPESFENALMKAMDGVNSSQLSATQLSQKMLTDPDSVDVHDVTIAQAEASLSLNIARTVINRVVTDWKDVINTR